MVTHLSKRVVGAGLEGPKEHFETIGPAQTVIEPLSYRCSRLLEEAIQKGIYIQIGRTSYIVNRIVEVEIEGQTKTKAKLERIEKL